MLGYGVCIVSTWTNSVASSKMHKILMISLYFHYTLCMFRTVLVHHEEQLYKLYIVFGICQYVWSDVLVYTKYDVQLTNVDPEDGQIQSETCRAFNEK